MTKIGEIAGRILRGMAAGLHPAEAPVASPPRLDSLTLQPTPSGLPVAQAVLAPPPAPVAVLGVGEATAAEVFAARLLDVGSPAASSDDLLCAFIKLQVLDLSLGQTVAAHFEMARHHLVDAAFIQERRLRPLLDQISALRAQADSARDQAERYVGRVVWQLRWAPSGEQRSEPAVDPALLMRDLWKAAITSLQRSIAGAIEEDRMAKSLAAAGNFEEAERHAEQAASHLARIEAFLGEAGLPPDPGTMDALLRHGQESIAAGGDGSDIFARYLAANPEVLAKVLPGVSVGDIAARGLTDEMLDRFVAGLMESEPRQGRTAGAPIEFIASLLGIADPSLVEDVENIARALAYVDADALDPVIERYKAAYPQRMAYAEAPLRGALDAFSTAWELEARVYLILSAHHMALLAIREARRSPAQERVAEAQAVAVADLRPVVDGSRADQTARQDARVEADQNRNEVARLVLALAQRHQALHNTRRRQS